MEVSHETPVKQPKRLTSVVWNHFERIKNADVLYAVCLHCKKKLCGSSNSGTTHLRNHLVRCLKRSNFDVSQILSAKRKRKDSTLPQSTLGQSTLGMKNISYEEVKLKDEFISPMPLKIEPEQRRDDMIHMSNIAAAKFDQERSHLDLARMIMLHGYPLAMVDHAGFKIFVKNLQPMFEINNTTIESHCMNMYSKEKQNMYDTINHLHGRINLAIDLWGSAENSEYISVTANYVDEEWRLQSKMLNFVSLSPLSTDDVLSEAVIRSLNGWSIDRKLFSMTFDDCSSREIMVFRIKEWLSQNRPLMKNGELFDMRCITHLSKSIVQEILGASGGLIHKIRESIKHVKSTQAILGKFNEIAQQVGINTERHLTLDCRMQWNTTYMMLEAALGYRVAFSQMPEYDPAYLTPLSETEWEWASAVSSYMKVLLEFTNVFVGNKCPTSNIAFAELCDLHIQLNEWCKSDDDYLNSLALRMKNKFDTFWNKCSLALAIAAILDPRFKMKLVEYYYLQIYGDDASDHIKEVSDGLRELFTEYSMGSHLLDPDSVWPGNSLPSSSTNTGDKLEGFDRFLCETSQSQNISSDLDKYLEEPVFPRNYDFNILNWWKVHTPRYPVLSMMACDMLAIPVSTLGPDVVFSNGGRVLDHHLTSLSPDVREAMLCGQNWLKVEPQATSMPLVINA